MMKTPNHSFLCLLTSLLLAVPAQSLSLPYDSPPLAHSNIAVQVSPQGAGRFSLDLRQLSAAEPYGTGLSQADLPEASPDETGPSETSPHETSPFMTGLPEAPADTAAPILPPFQGELSIRPAPVKQTGETRYQQLNPRQKLFYQLLERTTVDAVFAAPSYNNDINLRQLSRTVEGVSGMVFTGEQAGEGYISIAPSQLTNLQTIYHDMQMASLAYRFDAPGVLWNYATTTKLSFETVNATQIRITTVDYVFSLLGREKEMIREQDRAVADIVDEIYDGNKDRYTNLRNFYGYLIQNNTYAYNPEDSILPSLPYSALIFQDDQDPTAYGYASALKLLCDAVNLPCVIAVNPTHAWNIVKMDDGLYYTLDLTTDGKSSPIIGTEFFLKGTKDLAEVNRLHEYAVFPSSLGDTAIRFHYPSRSEDAYEYIGGPKFPDVQKGDWFYDYVMNASRYHLFRGDSEGRFNPDNPITRAEFAAVLANLYQPDLRPYTTSQFPDVPKGEWYLPAVEWVKSKSYMSGDSNGRFRPNANITREEMCIVLANITGRKQETPSQKFTDDGSIASYAYGAVYFCRDAGLISGHTDGSFRPTADTTRVQAAIVFTKFVAFLAQEEK